MESQTTFEDQGVLLDTDQEKDPGERKFKEKGMEKG